MGNKAKHCCVMSTNFLFSSKLSRPSFEFSLKVKAMGSNPGILFKSVLLYKYLQSEEGKHHDAKYGKCHDLCELFDSI